jgi:RNA polymerase sigma factor (TIGR02999 family)
MNASDTLTDLLAHWHKGHDVHARILPLVYADLRRIAGGLSARERTDHTLQATGLVNEAYIRLAAGGPFDSRAHFFGAAANAMRQTLVDYARRRNAVKRPSALVRVELEESSAAQSDEWREILEMDDALSRLEALNSRQHELVKLRYFAGLTLREAADALRISLSTAKADWSQAKTWLKKQFEM